MVEGPFYVTFMMAGSPRRMATPDHEPWPLDQIKDGFWITANYTLCRETQGTYWIPPGQILLIEKRQQAPEML